MLLSGHSRHSFCVSRDIRVLAGHPYPLRLVSGRQRGAFKSPWLHGQGQNVQPMVASLLSSIMLCPVFLFEPHGRPLASLATPRALEPVQLYRSTQAAESREGSKISFWRSQWRNRFVACCTSDVFYYHWNVLSHVGVPWGW